MKDLFATYFRAQAVTDIFSEKNTLAQLLRVEAALAEAQAAAGLLSAQQAALIKKCCKTDLFDLERIRQEVPLGGNLAIPLVGQLTELVRARDAAAARFVHHGATSQDIVDTATVLQIRAVFAWFEPRLRQLEQVLLNLARRHADTVMMGRTLLQQALPITFGHKAEGWLETIRRSQKRLVMCKKSVLKIQLGGPVGIGGGTVDTLVRQAMAKKLGLHDAPSWHTQRDTIADFATVLGVLAGNLGKIARDISILMQDEIGELSEGATPGRGGSSSMAHKRNPVLCTAILANATRIPHLVATILSAMPQENERSAGLWHAEWEPLADIAILTAGSVERAVELLEGLEVNAERMRENVATFKAKHHKK